MIYSGWNAAVWDALFDKLLNVPSCEELPSLAALREQIDATLLQMGPALLKALVTMKQGFTRG